MKNKVLIEDNRSWCQIFILCRGNSDGIFKHKRFMFIQYSGREYGRTEEREYYDVFEKVKGNI